MRHLAVHSASPARYVVRARVTLERLCAGGHSDGQLGLVEHAIQRLEVASGQVDDSGGELGILLEQLQALHHQVAAKSSLDGAELGRRLYSWAKQSPLNVFYNAPQTYADVLGPEGLAAYRRTVEADFRELPPLVASDGGRRFDGERVFITSQMEAVARQTGGPEDVIEVLKRDLSSSYQYLRIAQECRTAGDLTRAVDWAERGLSSFKPDSRLRSLLAELKVETGDPSGAADLAWTNFAERPNTETYTQLRQRAEAAGQWDELRARAHQRVRGTMNGPAEGNARALLVELVLHDGDADAAHALAQSGICADSGWQLLAYHFEKKRPLDSASIYISLLDSVLAPAKKQAYRVAVHQLSAIHTLLKNGGDEKRFASVVEAVRHRHGLKRRFMLMLDAAGM